MGIIRTDWYDGMSRRAHQAYDRGEMPISKWSKKAILAEWGRILHGDRNAWAKQARIGKTRAESLDVDAIMDALKGLTLPVLRSQWLYRSSWHHTGKYRNRTDFHRPDLRMLGRVARYAAREGMDVRDAVALFAQGGPHGAAVIVEHDTRKEPHGGDA